MKETEITVQVFEKREDIFKKLEENGFKMLNNFEMNDYYFSKHSIDEIYAFDYENLIKNVNIPVFWSGDISTIEDVEYAKSIGCAGVMIGRNAMGNPEIFSKLKGIEPPYSKKDAIKKHLELLKTYFKYHLVIS